MTQQKIARPIINRSFVLYSAGAGPLSSFSFSISQQQCVLKQLSRGDAAHLIFIKKILGGVA